MSTPYLIASYPRSGSTWLRFILSHLFHPDKDVTFDFINKWIPDIDDRDGMRASMAGLRFYKTHNLRHGHQVIFLHRHVGDVLVSEWWFKRKFYAEARPLENYLRDDDYGTGWRAHIHHYFPCPVTIGYEALHWPAALLRTVAPSKTETEIRNAVIKSTFANLQRKEEKGFGNYPSGDTSIKFIRSGKTGQWHCLPDSVKTVMLEKNYTELKILGYL